MIMAPNTSLAVDWTPALILSPYERQATVLPQNYRWIHFVWMIKNTFWIVEFITGFQFIFSLRRSYGFVLFTRVRKICGKRLLASSWPSVRLSVPLSVRLSVRPSVRPSICLSVRPHVCLAVLMERLVYHWTDFDELNICWENSIFINTWKE